MKKNLCSRRQWKLWRLQEKVAKELIDTIKGLLLIWNNGGQKTMKWKIQSDKIKNKSKILLNQIQPRIQYTLKLSFTNESEMKTFSVNKEWENWLLGDMFYKIC